MAGHIKHTTEDGHTAEALHFHEPVPGAVFVVAACCGLVGQLVPCPCGGNASCRQCRGSGEIKGEDTRQVHVFYDAAAKSDAEIESQVRGHVQRVAKNHGMAKRSRSCLAGMVKDGAKPLERGLPTTGDGE